MAHNTIFCWGNKLLKTPTIYIALTRRSKKKIQCLFTLEQFLHKYNLTLYSQASSSQHLTYSDAFQGPKSCAIRALIHY